MRTSRATLLGLVLAGVLLGGGIVLPEIAMAQITVDFIISAPDIQKTFTPTNPGDVALVIGRSLGTMDLSGCSALSPATAEVQFAVLANPGTGTPAGQVSFMVIIRSDTLDTSPLLPGTRIRDITGLGPCTLAANLVSFLRFRGTVD